jgi:hypothetical protein
MIGNICFLRSLQNTPLRKIQPDVRQLGDVIEYKLHREQPDINLINTFFSTTCAKKLDRFFQNANAYFDLQNGLDF